jgi:hypothetical protein
MENLYQPAGEGPPEVSGTAMPLGSTSETSMIASASVPAMQQQFGRDENGSLLPGEWEHEDTHMLGLATITAATGTFIGARFGGPYGAVAGVLVGGAIINTLRAIKLGMRAEPASDREALISGTYAVICAAGGGWLGYYGHKRKSSGK